MNLAYKRGGEEGIRSLLSEPTKSQKYRVTNFAKIIQGMTDLIRKRVDDAN
jgi:hypothetical protein